jgi:serine/threonine-protein kinase
VASPSESGVLLPGQVVAERYRIVRVVGFGSMGAVLETEDLQRGGSHVAVKVLRAAEGEKDAKERRARFLREAAVCASLRGANIVPVLDHGIDAATGAPFLVMPMLSGEDLGRAIERLGPLEPRACVALFLQACDALSAAHAAGVVHRDIKPSNLFLVEDATQGALGLWLGDFGLAKVEASLGTGTLTTSGAFMGTAQYVSPEQATNAKHVDARSDVWSMAMTLYHALAGRPAFAQTGSFLALVLEITGSRGVSPLQDVAPWVDPRIARAVHGALVRDPELRCPSINELALALRMAIGFDAARAKVTAADLRGVTPELRARAAERASLPASWGELLRS